MTVEQIFDKVYKRYYRKCVLFAKSYTHDISQAEDIVAVPPNGETLTISTPSTLRKEPTCRAVATGISAA